MDIHDLRSYQVHFENQINGVLESRQELHNLRDSFSKYYNSDRIAAMTLENYAIGNKLPKQGYNFCYTLERKLDGLGRIIGATAFKFGVYYGRTKSDSEYKYRFTKKFGTDHEEAFKNVKSELLNLIEAGRNENIELIVRNKLSSMFKGKILCTYYPDRYLNVFSDDHLKYFLLQLNIDTHDLIRSDAIIKREALIAHKNQDSVMKNWSVDLFSHFLYRFYPGQPPKDSEKPKPKDILTDYHHPNFPLDPNPDWVEMTIQPIAETKFKSQNRKGGENPDYEVEARKLKKLGSRGEKIAFEMEIKRLKELGKLRLSQKVEKAEFDYLGYDIKSFEENGDPRYIEVKTTRSRVGTVKFFLTVNELNQAKKLPNYYVYVVYDILSNRPKIWQLPNPFMPENKKIIKTAISFRVVINAELNQL